LTVTVANTPRFHISLTRLNGSRFPGRAAGKGKEALPSLCDIKFLHTIALKASRSPVPSERLSGIKFLRLGITHAPDKGQSRLRYFTQNENFHSKETQITPKENMLRTPEYARNRPHEYITVHFIILSGQATASPRAEVLFCRLIQYSACGVVGIYIAV
jgi:hypothetical protein